MNWTGGRLQRSRRPGISAKQKANFAKARSRAQIRHRPTSPIRLDHFGGIEILPNASHQPAPSPRSWADRLQLRNVECVPSSTTNESGVTQPRRKRRRSRLASPQDARNPGSIILGANSEGVPQQEQKHPRHNPSTTQETKLQARSLDESVDVEAKRQELLARDNWLGSERSKPLKMTFIPSHERDRFGRRRRLRDSEAGSKRRIGHTVVDLPKHMTRTRLELDHPASPTFNTEDISVRVGGSIHGSQKTVLGELQASWHQSSPDQSSSGYMLFKSDSASSQLSGELLSNYEKENQMLEEVEDSGKGVLAPMCDMTTIHRSSPLRSISSVRSRNPIRDIQSRVPQAQTSKQRRTLISSPKASEQPSMQPSSSNERRRKRARVDSRRLIFSSLPQRLPLNSGLSGDASSLAARFDSLRSVQAGTTVGKGTPVKSQNEKAWMAFMNVKGSSHTSSIDENTLNSHSSFREGDSIKKSVIESRPGLGGLEDLLELRRQSDSNPTNQSHLRPPVVDYETGLITNGDSPSNKVTKEENELWYKFIFSNNSSPPVDPISSLRYLEHNDSSESSEMPFASDPAIDQAAETSHDEENCDSSMAVEISHYSIHQASEIASVGDISSSYALDPPLSRSEPSANMAGIGLSSIESPDILATAPRSYGRHITTALGTSNLSSTTSSPQRILFSKPSRFDGTGGDMAVHLGQYSQLQTYMENVPRTKARRGRRNNLLDLSTSEDDDEVLDDIED